ncbi:uncharacterized protein MKZ38_009926 [Zalerion maritima]|uniref:Nephrocystin 3-like N-terminal domain-containing protein n=1 Tax=Zalerion maritima TaxID=339359 RepID=A0AAD5RUL0_9PEZI|nr:uncharacterized protein MKZ38_009926 [Zalerion maritima]
MEKPSHPDDADVLAWLTPLDYTCPLSDLISARHGGTLDWFFNSSQFLSWRDNAEAKTLVVRGPSGTGKSVITANAVKDLHSKCSGRQDTAVAYLYCDSQRDLEESSMAMMKCIIRQLVDPRLLAQRLAGEGPSPEKKASVIPGTIKSMYEASKDDVLARPSWGDIYHAFSTVLRLYSKVYIVIDALDECQMSDPSKKWFLERLFRFQKERRGVKIAMAYNPENPENDGPKQDLSSLGCKVLELESAAEDIKKFLSDTIVSQLENREPGEFVFDELIQEGVAFSRNNFLLAQQYIGLKFELDYDAKFSSSVAQSIMEEPMMSGGYPIFNQMYFFSVRCVQGSCHDRTVEDTVVGQAAITFLSLVRGTLSRDELKAGISIWVQESDPRYRSIPDPLTWEYILYTTRGLVKSRTPDRVTLIHPTARKYFKEVFFPGSSRYQVPLVKCFLKYLVSDGFISSGDCPAATNEQGGKETAIRKKNPLQVCIVNTWGQHLIRAAGHEGFRKWPRRILETLTMDFLTNAAAVATAVRVLQTQNPRHFVDAISDGRCALHLCAFIGLSDFISKLLDLGHDINHADPVLGNPLCICARGGHIETLKLLLERGADPSIRSNTGDTALLELSRFARGDAEEMASMLVEEGNDPNSANNKGMSALHVACISADAEMVEILLSLGARVDEPDKTDKKWTPLVYALEVAGTTVVDALIKAGADVNYVDGEGVPALHHAAARWEGAAAQCLLDAGANVNAASRVDGSTALHIAARLGNASALSALLGQLLPGDAIADNDGKTARDFADRELLGYLREKAVAVFANRVEPGILKWVDAMQAAKESTNPDAEWARVLQAGPPGVDLEGDGGLLAAFRELVAAGLCADGNSTDAHDVAMAFAEGDIMTWFLQTCVLVACERGYKETVRTIMSGWGHHISTGRGKKVFDFWDVRPGKDKRGQTPLGAAIKGGWSGTVRVLLGMKDEEEDGKECVGDKGGGVKKEKKQDENGGESKEEWQGMGADPRFADEYGVTPLEWARKVANRELEDMILEKLGAQERDTIGQLSLLRL